MGSGERDGDAVLVGSDGDAAAGDAVFRVFDSKNRSNARQSLAASIFFVKF